VGYIPHFTGDEGNGLAERGGSPKFIAGPSPALSWSLWLNPQDCHRCRWRATTNNLIAPVLVRFQIMISAAINLGIEVGCVHHDRLFCFYD